jgi:hydrogenase-4 membrane subunit HyfE
LRYDDQRGDFFLLADAFLRGRTWIEPSALATAWDRIDIGGRTYLPFAPFPALALTPLVALLGAAGAAAQERTLLAALAAASVALCWRLAARFDGGRGLERVWVVVLYAFSTSVWWITVIGGAWHLSQLFALCLTFLALLEATGRRRPLILGLLAGAAFLSRAPLALALPFFVWVAARDDIAERSWRGALRRGGAVLAGFIPAVVLFCAYDAIRFGSPLETGYGLAALSPALAQQRALGLFALAHLGRNLDYLFLRLPVPAPPPRFLSPDGFGLSVFITSPGLLLAARGALRDPLIRASGATALAVLTPSLFYYGGGYFQLGFRYLLDALPFLMPLVASGVRGGMGAGWKAAILFGVAVSLWAFASLAHLPEGAS